MHEASEGSPLAPEGLIVIAGPTASGKTELAVALARRLSGEVLSADSRQIYRHLDAGTAKPVRDRQGRVDGIAYHLLDCLEPDMRINAERFAAMARPVLSDVRARGNRPILAGGTGLYLKALLEGLDPMPPADPDLRKRLEAEAARTGREALHERLSRIDPEAAAKIPANNLQRVVRALEVHELTGRPISSFWRIEPGEARRADRRFMKEDAVFFTIQWPPEVLRERIARRARAMWPEMLREVAGLLKRFTGREPAFESLGYREALACVEGRLAPEAGLARMISATLAYAKRQRTWFRNQTPSIPIRGATPEEMAQEVLTKLEARP